MKLTTLTIGTYLIDFGCMVNVNILFVLIIFVFDCKVSGNVSVNNSTTERRGKRFFFIFYLLTIKDITNITLILAYI